jgi:hypothetical protein
LACQEDYSDIFDDNHIGPTFDVDFIVQMGEACQACKGHTNGELPAQKPDDPTLELGALSLMKIPTMN